MYVYAFTSLKRKTRRDRCTPARQSGWSRETPGHVSCDCVCVCARARVRARARERERERATERPSDRARVCVCEREYGFVRSGHLSMGAVPVSACIHECVSACIHECVSALVIMVCDVYRTYRARYICIYIYVLITPSNFWSHRICLAHTVKILFTPSNFLITPSKILITPYIFLFIPLRFYSHYRKICSHHLNFVHTI